MWTWCWNSLQLLQCRREAVKSTAWEVRSQDWNLKELAGEHHNAWSLRFNWIQRRTSHQGADSSMIARVEWPCLTSWEEVHGRRQLVPWGVLLSQATSETHALSYQRILRDAGRLKGTASDKLEEGVDDGRSVCPRIPWATRGLQWLGQWVPTLKSGGNPLNQVLVRIEGCNPPSREAGMRSNRVSWIARWNTSPAPCTHRPSRHPKRVWMRL